MPVSYYVVCTFTFDFLDRERAVEEMTDKISQRFSISLEFQLDHSCIREHCSLFNTCPLVLLLVLVVIGMIIELVSTRTVEID